MMTNEPKITEHARGTKRWYLNGKPHREDGPAVEHARGTKRWLINGEEIDNYYPNFGCFTPKNRQQALERLNRKERPYAYDLYLADIHKVFRKGA